MASGVQLATAYISLNVRTDDIKKQVSSALNGVGSSGRAAGTAIGSNIIAGIRTHLSGGTTGAIFAPIATAGIAWATKAGRAIGTALRTALISSVSMGIGAAVLGFGTALSAGLDRLKTLQQSRIQLSLTLNPQEISKLQSQIAEVVKGTNVTLDEAMAAVPKAINAGLNTDQVRQYVKDLADAAAATGGMANTGWLDEIFSKIRADGKLATDQIDSLNTAGLDIRGTLKKAFGWDDKTLQKNMKANKVGINEVQQAIQKVYGSVDAGNGKTGLAQLMGTKTLDGSIKAAKASLSRIGADFISAIVGKDPSEDPLESYAMGINKVTEGLKGIEEWIGRNRGTIHEVFSNGAEAAGKLWRGAKTVWEWLVKAKDTASELWDKAQDIGNKIASGFNTAKTAVQGFIDKIEEIWTNLKKWVVDKWDQAFGPNSPIGKFMDWLGIGPATANAATSTTPLNTGPMAPGLTPLPDTPPGFTRSFGTPSGGYNAQGQWVGPLPGAAATSSYPGDQGLLSRVRPGTYVSEAGVGDLTKGIGDCTSSIEDLILMLEGQSTDGRSMATGNAPDWLSKHGFIPTDKPMPGTFQVGFFNDPNAPGGGHMQATMQGGQNFNWGDDASAANRGMGGSGAWGDPRFNQHYYKKYSDGGGVWGSGSATSDSIPAWLSNGEHVLTAKEVQMMGGQDAVYAFRNGLKNGGAIRGYAPGGAVDPADPSKQRDIQNQMNQLNQAAELARTKQLETIQNPDATELQRVQSQQELSRALRQQQNYASDMPTLLAGGTAPDRSLQEELYNTTDQLTTTQMQLDDLKKRQTDGEDVPASSMLSAQYAVDNARQARYDAVMKSQNPNGGDQPASFLDNLIRTQGFTPTGGGGKAGTSSLAKIVQMPAQIVGGAIDTGTGLAKMAASAAITAGVAAGSFGGAAAAAPIANAAAGYGIDLAGAEAKVISNFWLGTLPGIAADALVAQMFPIGGPPRWMGYDYTEFAPQLGIAQAATTTLEGMGQQAIQKYFSGQQQPGAPVVPQLGPEQMSAAGNEAYSATRDPGPAAYFGAKNRAPVDGSNQKLLGPGDPGFYNPPIQPQEPPYIDPLYGGGAGGGNGGGGSWAKGGHVGIYDQGGVLKPGDIAVNKSKVPEQVLTKQQWDSMSKLSTKSGGDSPMVKIDAIYGMSPEDVANQIEQKQRLASMRFSGRPYK